METCPVIPAVYEEETHARDYFFILIPGKTCFPLCRRLSVWKINDSEQYLYSC